MPALNCPRCSVTYDADDNRLAAAFFCASCGACLWQPASTQAEPPPPIQRPRQKLVYAAPDSDPSRRHTVNALSLMLIAMGIGFAILVAVFVLKRFPAARPLADDPVKATLRTSDPPPAPRSATPQLSNPKESQPTAPAASLTIADVIARIEASGLEVKISDRVSATTPSVWITVTMNSKESRFIVSQYKSPAMANSAANVDPLDQAARIFVWDRFTILGPDGPAFRAIVKLFH